MNGSRFLGDSRRRLICFFSGLALSLVGCTSQPSIDSKSNSFFDAFSCRNNSINSADFRVIREFSDNLRALQSRPDELIIESRFENCFFQIVSADGTPISLMGEHEFRKISSNQPFDTPYRLRVIEFQNDISTGNLGDFHLSRLAVLEDKFTYDQSNAPGWVDLAPPDTVLIREMGAVFGIIATIDGTYFGEVAIFGSELISIDGVAD